MMDEKQVQEMLQKQEARFKEKEEGLYTQYSVERIKENIKKCEEEIEKLPTEVEQQSDEEHFRFNSLKTTISTLEWSIRINRDTGESNQVTIRQILDNIKNCESIVDKIPSEKDQTPEENFSFNTYVTIITTLYWTLGVDLQPNYDEDKK